METTQASTDRSRDEQSVNITTEYYSAINKNERMPFARTWMDLDNVILTEVTRPEKDKCHMIAVISVILKMVQMNLLKML